MSTTATLVDVMFCDQVRREDNGKLLILGLYLDTVVLRAVPCTIPSFTFVVKWRISGASVPAGRYAIVDPTGHECASIEAPAVPFPEKANRPRGSKVLASHQLSPFVFTAVGTYRLMLQRPKSKARTLATFEVRLADSEKRA